MTKAEEVFRRVTEMVDAGTTKADAFKQLAEEYGQPVNSLRGSFYSFSKKQDEASGESSPRRTRRRVTTTEDAMADARAVLDRAIAAVDAEVEQAQRRATEAQAEYEALKDGAEAKKTEIAAKRDALS